MDEKEYRKRKKDSLLKRGTDQEKKLIEEQLKNAMFERLVGFEGVTNLQKSKILGIPEGTYYYKLKNYQETGEL